MNRRLIAATLLAVLTVLGGLDFFEDTGLIHYSTSEMDRSVEDVLDNYGEAIRSTSEGLADDFIVRFVLTPCFFQTDLSLVAFRDPLYDRWRKQSLDCAESGVSSLTFSEVFLV